jgi:Rha family phage regulatory protein
MQYLIPLTDDGLFVDAKTERIFCDSRFVAQAFGKEHYNVLRDIKALLENPDGLSSEFVALNFEGTSYRDSQNKKRPSYHLTRDGFTMLVMGYTGADALRFKEQYIKRFNEMERTIAALKPARADYPLMTEQIRLAHDDPKPYHFTNEVDMINRIVLGVSAKQYKLSRNISVEETSIRPHLTGEELKMIDYLQMLNAGMIAGGMPFEQRKTALIAAASRKSAVRRCITE